MSIRNFNGKSPHISDSVYIDSSAILIGDVTVGEFSSVWPMAIVRADVNSIRIGATTNIQDASVLHVSHDSDYSPGGFKLDIGTGVTVGHKVILHGCTVGDYCLLGMASTVMDGALLEPRTMLGAGTLVPPGKILNSGYLYIGSPAHKARLLNETELAYLEYSAKHYAKLAKQYRSN